MWDGTPIPETKPRDTNEEIADVGEMANRLGIAEHFEPPTWRERFWNWVAKWETRTHYAIMALKGEWPQ